MLNKEMTNEELKYKIVKIIQGVPFWENPLGWFGINERAAEKLADALIERGLTFDRNTAVLAERMDAKTLICKAQRYDEMKHRAEVAEKALEILNGYECISNPIRYYMKQAEKENEEKKSEKRP